MEAQNKTRLKAAFLSLIVGIIIMLGKFFAYKITNSQAILSDALESIVNVVGAAFSLYAIKVAQEPPDEKHPYGHGKLEFVTAVFEGGLITFAALLIAYEAVQAFMHGSTPKDLHQGLYLITFFGALNGLLGLFLIRTGKKTSSLALLADGKHVFSDFLSSVGIIIGIIIVYFTKQYWLDNVMALAMAALLIFAGIDLVKEGINGLIDATDEELMVKLLAAIEKCRVPGFIRLHHVRAMRNGRRIHVDGHVVLPEFWSVQVAHDRNEVFQNKIVQENFIEGEIEFHIDPCRRVYCKSCDLLDCPIRKEDFINRKPMTIEEITRPFDITD